MLWISQNLLRIGQHTSLINEHSNEKVHQFIMVWQTHLNLTSDYCCTRFIIRNGCLYKEWNPLGAQWLVIWAILNIQSCHFTVFCTACLYLKGFKEVTCINCFKGKKADLMLYSYFLVPSTVPSASLPLFTKLSPKQMFNI